MIAIPVTILALAAGIYLLIHVRQSGLGALYKYLSWLVVILSLLFILCSVVRGVRHHHHMHECHASGQCSMGHEGPSCPYAKAPGCCMQGGHAECAMGAQGCSKDSTGRSCCNKDGGMGKAPCCTKGADGAKPACCAKAAADSTAKK